MADSSETNMEFRQEGGVQHDKTEIRDTGQFEETENKDKSLLHFKMGGKQR